MAFTSSVLETPHGLSLRNRAPEPHSMLAGITCRHAVATVRTNTASSTYGCMPWDFSVPGPEQPIFGWNTVKQEQLHSNRGVLQNRNTRVHRPCPSMSKTR